MAKRQTDTVILNGDIVRDKMKDRRVTAQQVAAAVGVHLGTLNGWLRWPNPDKARRRHAIALARYLGCELIEIVYEERAWLTKLAIIGLAKLGLPTDDATVKGISQLLEIARTGIPVALFLLALALGFTGRPLAALLLSALGFLMCLGSLVLVKGAKWGYTALIVGAMVTNAGAAVTIAAIAVKERLSVRQTPPPIRDTKPAPPETVPIDDRKAAEYVLGIKGVVQVKEKVGEIKTTNDLPPGPLTLTTVILLGNQQVDDAGLSVLAHCGGLAHLALDETHVTDQGLTSLKGIKTLDYLGLSVTAVTDAGLANFKECKDLTYLGLLGTNVGDVGLANFKECKKLTGLQLGKTHVTDKGLDCFRDCNNLDALGLGENPQVGDDGLACFADCEKLTVVGLWRTQVSDKGLQHLRKAMMLRDLNLVDTNVTDAGLLLLKDKKSMMLLTLKKRGPNMMAGITDKGIAELQQALPDCKINVQ
jgi:hypothetical protein